jgi:hypothetical protein
MGDWMSRAFANIQSETASATGVKGLRAAMMDDGTLDATEVHKLIAIHKTNASPSTDPDWPDFLIEAVCDYFALSREVPIYHADELRPDWGRALHAAADALALDRLANAPQAKSFAERVADQGVSEADAAILIDAISANGLVLDQTEMGLLAALFDRAVTYPKVLRSFAWQTLQATVMADSKVGPTEVDLLRAMITGPASLEGIAVSKGEAEVLCEIDVAVDESSKDETWPAFFAQSIGSYLLYGGGTPGRLDASETAWLNAKLASGDTAGKRALKAFVAQWDGQT